MDFTGIYQPGRETCRRYQLYSWIVWGTVIVAILALTTTLDNASGLVVLAVVWLAEVFFSRDQEPSAAIYFNDDSISQGNHGPVRLANIKHIEFLPSKAPNVLLRRLLPHFQGRKRLRLVDHYHQKHTLDLSLLSHQDRIQIVNGLRHYCPDAF